MREKLFQRGSAKLMCDKISMTKEGGPRAALPHHYAALLKINADVRVRFRDLRPSGVARRRCV